MKKLALFALVAFTAAFATPRAEAQFSLIPYLGYNLELEGLMVGIGSEFAAPFAAGSLDLAIRPSIEYHSVDGDLNYFQINGDILARFSGSESIAPYAGAGLALAIISVPDQTVENPFGEDITVEGDSNTEIGLNVFGGAEFPGLFDFGMPFAQARYSIVDPTDQLSVFGGVKIMLGN